MLPAASFVCIYIYIYIYIYIITNLYNIHFSENHHKTEEILEKKIRAKIVRAYEYMKISEYSLPWGLFRFICMISTRNIAWN